MINLTIKKYKEMREKRANTIFLHGSVNSAYVHDSKPTKLENSIIHTFTT